LGFFSFVERREICGEVEINLELGFKIRKRDGGDKQLGLHTLIEVS